MNTPTMPEKRTFLASRWSVFLCAGLIALAGLTVYKNSFSGPFVFDDAVGIADNPTIRHLWPVWQALTPPHGMPDDGARPVAGRPIVNFSLAVNYAFGGPAVLGYHALNLAIHILAGLVLFGIVRRTLASRLAKRGFQISDFKSKIVESPATTQSEILNLKFVMPEATPLALAVAVLWVVHPLQTEAVTYLSQRAESLMGLFYLLTLYCFVRGVDAEKSRVKSLESSVTPNSNSLSAVASAKADQLSTLGSRLWLVASILACLLGMACKEVMVSAPLIVLLYDRTFVAGTFRDAWARRRLFYAALAATWFLLGYLVAQTQGRGGSAGFGVNLTAWEYALTQCSAIMHYLWLSLWPHPLILDYGMVVVKQPGAVVPQALFLILLVAGTLVGLRRWPAVGFVGMWFFAILAPSSSVVPIASQTIAEHRMYLPLAAVLVLLVTGLYACMGKKSLVVFLALAAWWGSLTIQRNEDYRSELGLWRDTVEKRPDNPRAHSTLGQLLQQTGQLPEAIAQDEEALRLKPNYAQAHNNLGVALCESGKISEGLAQFDEALRIKPNFAEACYNLGATLQLSGRNSEAIQYFERTLELSPEHTDARTNLGIALAMTGKASEAAQQFEELLRQHPDSAEAHVNLAMALTQLGRTPEAIQHYEEALRLDPGYETARSNLAQLQAAQSPPDSGANKH
jgi:Flp pilus assembly protein TadD